MGPEGGGERVEKLRGETDLERVPPHGSPLQTPKRGVVPSVASVPSNKIPAEIAVVGAGGVVDLGQPFRK